MKYYKNTFLFISALTSLTTLSQVATATPSLILVASGFNQPLFTTSAGDARQFVVEQGGAIKVITGITVSTFMTVPNIVSGGEKGLLGLAFDPDYASNGRFYVNVTVGDNRGRLFTQIRRYTRLASDPNKGDPVSGKVSITYLQPYENHNGGWLAFGPDKLLYIAVGDGGSGYDPGNRAQNLKAPLGKLLRIDVRGISGYTIPPTNPFVNTPGAFKPIFAYGLRNPFRDSFDRLTGDLYIGDVGKDTREEIDVIKAGTSGQNFGWRYREGTIATPNVGKPKRAIDIDPIYDYPHGSAPNAGQGESVIGGYVYRGPVTSLKGKYVFGDFISGGLWSLNTDGSNFQNLTGLLSSFGGVNISSFGEDVGGNLYIVDYNGKLLKFVGN